MAPRSPRSPSRRAEDLCGRLRAGAGRPDRAMEGLRALGDAAVPAVAALARERGAGYSFAVRVLAAASSPEAAEALAEVVADPGTRDCDRLEAAMALADRGDPRGLPAVRALALSPAPSPLRAAAYHCLRGMPGGLSAADLLAGPLAVDPELRPLVLEDLRTRGLGAGAAPDGPPGGHP